MLAKWKKPINEYQRSNYIEEFFLAKTTSNFWHISNHHVKNPNENSYRTLKQNIKISWGPIE